MHVQHSMKKINFIIPNVFSMINFVFFIIDRSFCEKKNEKEC